MTGLVIIVVTTETTLSRDRLGNGPNNGTTVGEAFGKMVLLLLLCSYFRMES